MRCDARASSLLDTQCRDVECFPVLELDHVMSNNRPVPGDEFRHRIAERGAGVERHIVLDDDCLAVFLCHDQVPRMAHAG